MNTKHTKLICLMLVCAFALAVLVACNKVEENDVPAIETTEAPTTEATLAH